MAIPMTREEMLPWFGFKKAECEIYEGRRKGKNTDAGQ